VRPRPGRQVTGPQVLVREDEKERKKYLVPAPDMGWYLLGAMGFVFAPVGSADIALVCYPPNFGSAEFEFGSITQSMNSLPLPILGLALILAAGVARGIKWVPRAIAILMLVLLAVMIWWAFLYFTTIPQALKAVVEPMVKTGLKKAITKTTLQFVLYPLAFVDVSVKAWRHASASTRAVP